MAESTQSTRQTLRAPEVGQSVVVNAVLGQDIVLDAAFDQAEPKVSDNGVVFEFANGGQVVIDFSDLGDGPMPNIVMADGTVLNVQEFLASLGEGDVEPAAGPEGGAEGSGGVGEYRDDAGNLIEGVDKLGVLDPRDFAAITVEALDADPDDANPLPSAGLAFGAADEDGLRISELTMTPFDGNSDEADGDHPAEFAFAVGALSYDFGGDGPSASTPFAWSLAGLDALGVQSRGNALQYEVVDGGTTLNAFYVLDGYPGSEADLQVEVVEQVRVDVFSLQLTDLATGAYRFELYQPLDHSVSGTEDDILYNFSFTVTDGSGDSAVGGFNLIIDDDSPMASGEGIARTVDEDDIKTRLSEGNHPNDGDGDGSFTGSPYKWWDSGPANIRGSLASLVSFGADGPGENGFSLSEDLGALEAQNLHSKGEPLSYRVEGSTLIAFVGVSEPEGPEDDGLQAVQIIAVPRERIVFTLELESDGDYWFKLYDQLDHPTGDGQNNLPIDLASVIVATDGDGDSIVLDGGFTINVTDDVPEEAGLIPVLKIVEEEALPTGNQEPGDIWPDTAVASGWLTSQVSLGADEYGTFSLVEEPDGLASLSSGGVPVTYDVDGNVLTAMAGENEVFTLTLESDGRFTFVLKGPLDHAPGNGENLLVLDLSPAVMITDFDGDPVVLDRDFFIKIVDDVPTVDIALNVGQEQQALGAVVTDETSQLGETVVGAEPVFRYLVAASPGADGGSVDVALRIDAAATGFRTSLGGHDITLIADAEDNNIVYGQYTDGTGTHNAFTVVLDDDGFLRVTQHVAMMHPEPATLEGDPADTFSYDEPVTLDGKLSAVVRVVDADMDVAQDAVGIGAYISFKDDGPTAAADFAVAQAPEGVDYNVAWVLDFSGSIDRGELNTMLMAVKSAAEEIFNTPDAGDVSMTIIAFGANAVSFGPFSDLAAFNAKIDEIQANRPVDTRATDFTDAIEATMGAFVPQDGASNQVFFISDGNPNDQTGTGNALLPATAASWAAFVSDNNLNVVTIGVGNGIQTQPLQDVDVDGAGSPILIGAFDELLGTLLGQIVPGTPITGNVLSGPGADDFGADGGRILSIAIEQVEGPAKVYTWDGDGTITVTVNGASIETISGDAFTVATEHGGSLTFHFDAVGANAPGSWEYTPPATALPLQEVFPYQIIDGDGDVAAATLTIDVTPPAPRHLVVGENVSDTQATEGTDVVTDDHRVDTSPNAPDGPIVGGDGKDVLVGDVGGYTAIGKTANIILILDTSGSMGSGGKLAAQKNAVNELLGRLGTSDAEKVRVHIVEYNGNRSNWSLDARAVGTWTLVPGDALVGAEILAAQAAVNALTANGGTNYEAGLALAHEWASVSTNLLSTTDPTKLVNQVIFLSDGVPTYHYAGNGTVTAGPGNTLDTLADEHFLGVGDGDSFSEVGALEGLGFNIQAISIDNSANLDMLDLVDTDDASIVPPGGLVAALQGSLQPLLSPLTVGDDEIRGGDGDDVIFGDSIHADDRDGGWEQLLADNPGLTLDQLRSELYLNHETYGQEGSVGGDDTIYGGGGNDVIYGQGGSDLIDGGAGNDTIVGGTGDDIMTGGAGQDVFRYLAGDLAGSVNGDTITDFELGSGGDTLDLSALLSGATAGNLDQYLDFTVTNIAGGQATVAINVDPAGAGSHAATLATITVTGVGIGDTADTIIDTMINHNIDI